MIFTGSAATKCGARQRLEPGPARDKQNSIKMFQTNSDMSEESPSIAPARQRPPLPTTTAQFGANNLVTIIRARGTPSEKNWSAWMGGDLVQKALFYPNDRVHIGDELHLELFSEPKIITAVDPCMSRSGLSYWTARMMPQSEWRRTAMNGQQGSPFNIHAARRLERIRLGQLMEDAALQREFSATMRDTA